MKTHKFTTAGILFLTCLGISSLAQDNVTKEYINFGGGVTLPMGQYARGNYRVPGGYALPGSNYNLSFGITPPRFPIGFALECGYYFNKYDIDSYLKNHQTPEISAFYGTNAPNASKLFYHGAYALAGIYKEFPVTPKMSIDTRLLCGDMGISTPAVSFYSIRQNEESTWDIAAQKGNTISYNAGASLRIKPTRCVNISINVDYLYSDFRAYTVSVLYAGSGSGTSFSTTTPTTVSGGSGTGSGTAGAKGSTNYSGTAPTWNVPTKAPGTKPYSTTNFSGFPNTNIISTNTQPIPIVSVPTGGNQGIQRFRSSSNVIVSQLCIGLSIGINL